ncbi:hypothetical protein CSW64_10635 [Caulobacter mirabilis]|uniref:TonB C-terminal domain-containing protein n=2 Tax=Caulobacter mirabilis TaxID=69666 RepID=A0A2D2AXX3_9CAUL|nr:hypothetical protein CSW64_10635 [Caulobacter mirabilis]
MLAAALAAWPMIAAAAGEPLVGPLRVGMPFAEVKATAPDAGWVETASQYSGKPIELRAAEAIPLAGRLYDLTITPGAYDAYEVRLEHEAPIAAARDCAPIVKALAAELEGRFGPFVPASTLKESPDWAYVVPGGRLVNPEISQRRPTVVSLGPAKTDGGSRLDHGRASVSADFRYWIGRRPPRDNLAVSVGAETDWRGGAPICRTGVVFDYRPPRPERDTIAFETLQPVRRPTISARNRAVEPLGDLPPEGVVIRLDCSLARRQGLLEGCAPPPETPEARGVAARNVARGYRFDVKALDPDNDVPLRIEVPITLSPSDRREVTPPEGLVPLTAAEAPLSSIGDMGRYYPSKALAQAVEGRVLVVCQIQSDQSLICPSETVESSAPELFAGISRRVEELYRARSTLTSGELSAGRWVKVAVSFRMAG